MLALYYDYSKAFDSLAYQTLADTQVDLGMDHLSVSWTQSFLSDRTSQVVIRNTAHDGMITDILSEPITMTCGCPQGSVISPSLFNTYSHTLFLSIINGLIIAYADDTNHIIKNKSLSDTIDQAKLGINAMLQWSKSHNLDINSDKTKLMQFHTKNNNLDSTPLLKLGDSYIQPANVFKFLGLTLTETLDWSEHCKVLNFKLRSACFLIRSLRGRVPLNILKTAYYGNFYAHLQYAIIFWGYSACSKPVFLLQKRAIRAIFGLSQYTSCAPYFKELNILTLPSIFIYECAKFVRRNPERFNLNSDIHNYPTRNASDIRIPQHKLKLCDNSPSFIIPRVYNALPENIKSVTNFNTFKSKLFIYLVANTFYDTKQFFSRV